MRRCIFCGGSPLTSTHVFRKAWLERLMPSTDPSEQRHSREVDVVVRSVCAMCNDGWMDDVDRAGEALAEPMTMGLPTTLDAVNEHRTFATWVTLVAILMDQMQEHPAISHIQHLAFHENREPFDRMVIWLARTITRGRWQLDAWSRLWPSLGDTPPSDRPHAYFPTFRINDLVVQAFIPLDAPTLSLERGENMRFVRQLWPSPSMPVSWPPDMSIASESLQTFATAFEREPESS